MPWSLPIFHLSGHDRRTLLAAILTSAVPDHVPALRGWPAVGREERMTAMALDPKVEAALALHRFGLGPRAGSIAAIASDPRGALMAELDRPGAGRINDAGIADQRRSGPRRNQISRRSDAPSGSPSAPRATANPAQRATPATPSDMEPPEAAAPAAGAANAGPGVPQQLYLDEAKARIRCRARRRDRLRRAAGVVLVEPFLRLRRQGQRASDLRRLRARSHPRACARPLRRHAARGRDRIRRC